jgi:hypothetical protein
MEHQLWCVLVRAVSLVGMYNRGTTGAVYVASGMYGTAVLPPNGAATIDIQVMLHVMLQAACLSEVWAVQYHGCNRQGHETLLKSRGLQVSLRSVLTVPGVC